MVDELDFCTEIDCYLSGTDDENLMIIEAKPNEGFSLEVVNKAIEDLLEEFIQNIVGERELQKVINKQVNYLAFTNESHSNKAFNLAYFKSIERLYLYNNEQSEYLAVDAAQIQRVAAEIFKANNCNTLFYKSLQK